jgi:hypothetical protein
MVKLAGETIQQLLNKDPTQRIMTIFTDIYLKQLETSENENNSVFTWVRGQAAIVSVLVHDNQILAAAGPSYRCLRKRPRFKIH